MRTLYLGKRAVVERPGGRELLCNLNYDILQSLYGDQLARYNLPRQQQRGINGLLNAFRGYIDGISGVQFDAIIGLVREQSVQQVFVDGSNLGSLVRTLKKRCPDINVVTFFHNVETVFFWGAFLSRMSIKSFLVLLANRIAEGMAVCNSDQIICLSQRDSCLLKRLYGRGATHVSPIALRDSLNRQTTAEPGLPSGRFALFVGGSFYANVKAIEWYATYISRSVNIPLYVVGHGFERLRAHLNHFDNIVIVGSVHSLSEWYRQAQVVVAPIFYGSGMKTKVAEALMHGKHVVGTPEAFSGYEDFVDVAGWCCRDSDEFIEKINQAVATDMPVFDHQLRAVYELNYSFNAAEQRFADILADGRTPLAK